VHFLRRSIVQPSRRSDDAERISASNRTGDGQESLAQSNSVPHNCKPPKQQGAQAAIGNAAREELDTFGDKEGLAADATTEKNSSSGPCEQHDVSVGGTSFTPEASSEHSCVQQVTSGAETFGFRVGVVDLERKPITAVQKHHELDQQIMCLVHAPRSVDMAV
jgi:hypothetical protein